VRRDLERIVDSRLCRGWVKNHNKLLLRIVMKRKFIILYLLAALVVPLIVSAQDQMTVEDAIKIGLKNNYDILIAKNTAEIAVNNKGKGIAGFLPVIDTSGNFRYDASNDETGAPSSFGNSDSRTYGSQLSLNWTLFDGFGMFANKVRYDELAKLGEYEARNNIENTVVGIMIAYFDLVQQEQLLDVALKTRDISRTRLDRETVRRDLGGVSSTDLLNARVNFNNDQAVLLDQELRVAIAKKELNLLLSRDPHEEITVKKVIRVLPLNDSYDTLLRSAEERNSFLLTAKQNVKVAAEGVRLSKSSFWPRLSLNANYGYNDRALFGDDVMSSARRRDETIDASVGLSLTFNLFNGNIDSINYQNAVIEEKNSVLLFKNIKNQLAGLVLEKYTTFNKRAEKVHLEDENVGTAEQNLKLQKERYAVGASDSLDFRDAQVNMVRANTSLIVARYQARITLLEIEQLIGKIEIEE